MNFAQSVACRVLYGVDCETGFTFNVFDMSGEDKVYCSKLVWRVFQQSEDYQVNVDSNHQMYIGVPSH